MDFKSVLSKLDVISSAKETLKEGWEDMMKASKEKADKDTKDKGTGKFDKKETSTGTVYTRKSSTFDDGGEDKDVKKAKKKDKEEKKEKKVKESMADFIKAIDAISESGEKKPDEDGDGVPDWADKKPGKDDNEDDKDSKDDKDDDKDDDKESKDDLDEAADMDKIPAYVRKPGEKSQKAAQAATDKRNKNAGAQVWSSKRAAPGPVTSPSLQECYDQAMSAQTEQESGMNISSNMDTKTGSQSLTVTAQGAAADQLAQILKLSGVLGGTEGTAEVEVEVDEAGYANEPQPEVQEIGAQLQQGNDLNRPKQTYPKVARGDNPMQAVAAMESRAAEELSNIEKRLMEQLESIKVYKK